MAVVVSGVTAFCRKKARSAIGFVLRPSVPEPPIPGEHQRREQQQGNNFFRV
jgi:hypothetical protein